MASLFNTKSFTTSFMHENDYVYQDHLWSHSGSRLEIFYKEIIWNIWQNS